MNVFNASSSAPRPTIGVYLPRQSRIRRPIRPRWFGAPDGLATGAGRVVRRHAGHDALAKY